MDSSAPTPDTIRDQIEKIPDSALPSILTLVLKRVIHAKTYGNRSVTEIVRTLENQLKGRSG